MDPNKVPNAIENVIWRQTDDGAVLVSPESGDIRVLNEVGTTIWELIDGKRSVAQIESQLEEKYEVPPARLRADLHAFLEELSKRHLLDWKGKASSAAG